MWNPNLASLLQSEVAIPNEMHMLQLCQIMRLQDFLSSSKFCIENELEVDEINIKVRNQTKLNLVGPESQVYLIEKNGIRPSLNTYTYNTKSKHNYKHLYTLWHSLLKIYDFPQINDFGLFWSILG